MPSKPPARNSPRPPKSLGFSGSRRIGSAKVHEFSLITKFPLGYRNREDITALPPGVLIKGSQNMLTDVTGRVGITKGYALDGASSTTLASILGAYDWEVQGAGERHLRAISPSTTNGSDGKLQWRYVDATTGTVTWKDLLTGLSSGTFNFAEWWNTTNLQALLLMVNGSSGIWEWSGGTGLLSGASNAAGEIAAITFNQTGVNPNLGGTGYAIGDILDVAGGVGGQVKVTSLVNNTVKTISVGNGGGGYAANDVLTLTNGNNTSLGATGATVKVLTVAAGVVQTIQLLTQGSGGSPYSLNNAGYAAGQTYATTGGGGAGATITVNTIGTGAVATVSLQTSGSGYGTGNAVATTASTGTGAGATINITTVSTGHISISGDLTVPQNNFYLTNGILLINGTQYKYTSVNGNVFLGVTPDPSAEAVGSVIVQTPKFTDNSSMTSGMATTFANDLIATVYNQAYVGSLVSNQVWVSSITDYTNFASSTPRTPGQGALFTLSANSVAFIPEEDAMYISCGTNDWFKTVFSLSSDLTKEGLTISKLKTTEQQGTQSQALTAKIRNNVVFVSNEPTVSSLGRVDNVVLTPQISDISFPIINDMVSYDFTDGCVFYWRNYMLVAVPKQSVVRVYNMTNGGNTVVVDKSFYWEAPLTFPISRFSIIDGDLYGHSYQTPESYKLFTGYNFNGHPIPAKAVFSYTNEGVPSQSKSFDEFYVEGYISSNASLTVQNTFDLNGSAGTQSFTVLGTDTRIVNLISSKASIGKSSLGKNPLGGDLSVTDGLPPKFRVIFTAPRIPYYEYSPSFSSSGIDYNWSILRFGAAEAPTSEGNNDITI